MKKTIALLISTLCLLSTFGQQWNWLENKNLSYARGGMTATVLDDSIFFSGGTTNWLSTFSNTVDIYDIGDNTWSSNELPAPHRFQATTIAGGGKVFIAGGMNYPGDDCFAEVNIFTKETGEWTVDSLSVARAVWGSAIVFDNKVYFAGGAYYNTGATQFIYTDVIDIYDLETESWSVEYLSIPRGSMGVAAAGGKIYFAGGATGNYASTKIIDIYDPVADEWTVDSLSEARAGIAGIAYDDRIYFAGGSRPNGSTCKVIDVYNTTNNAWQDTINLQNFRIVYAMRVMDAIIFAGTANYIHMWGPGYIGPQNGVIEIYYPNTNVWDYSVSNLDPARWFYAFVTYENKAYFAGGKPSVPATTAIVNIIEYDSHCLPDGIDFNSQEDIDDFYGDHPGCYDIEGDVVIYGDDIDNLNGLDLISSIGGNLSIISNDLLTSLTGLENLTSIGGNLEIIGNPGLATLSGLGNIDAASIGDLSIYGNPLLSDCDVWSICQYLGAPGGTIDIHTNAEGCNSKEEVEVACLTDVSEIVFDNQFTITPNPIKSTAIIEFLLHKSSNVNLAIHSMGGQEIVLIVNEHMRQGNQQLVINTNELPSGIYFCVLKTNYGIQIKKIIKL